MKTSGRITVSLGIIAVATAIIYLQSPIRDKNGTSEKLTAPNVPAVHSEREMGDVASGSKIGADPIKSATSSLTTPKTRAIAPTLADYTKITDPLEQTLTATSEADVRWMTENAWPTLEQIHNLIPSRDCPAHDFTQAADQTRIDIAGNLVRLNTCLARYFADGDTRYHQLTSAAVTRGSSFASRLELARLLQNPVAREDHGKIAEIAIQTVVLGDPSALELATKAGVGSVDFYRVQSAYQRALTLRSFAARELPQLATVSPRPRAPGAFYLNQGTYPTQAVPRGG